MQSNAWQRISNAGAMLRWANDFCGSFLMDIRSNPQMAMPMGMQMESEHMRNVFTSASCVSCDSFGDDELCTWKEEEKIPVAMFQQVENMKEYREN
ncbi:uncharacterized protein MONOS_11768 [Monocercomonoides exilis]|uniref:uncharacterized protein n=1 Tax=Monocercomonoides exilis TaxID=2049356 RepID=UPI00355A2126|nr:hypothetical protein MONOS_11768 [Monocercomonoides exilis]|eukprot:MONOS_11768.1-p1 / transcript=MONOS_11768.1 / gene=MONOS_11768 / organism=Monocercomonoides_exilis_PA203 / gene_product=unspecified product / transcript_product=unspecified product / location=Mono_scaffold00609:20227-20514(-) / protein_length=96 / sequence_SO=supercontig / SO=protein_coding / is_pseudo=false